ncbi:MAG: YajQ family cyclic di-GMP-binding protein [Pseudomonadota bacterium]
MPSFDVVSEVDKHELSNAVDQANREIANRYDFKGSDARIDIAGQVLTLNAQSEFQVEQMQPILYQKMTKRGIDVSCLDESKVEEIGQRARQLITVREGVDKELAKKIIRMVKDSKLKVQAAIQGEQVRITGKKRDDLQQVMGTLKAADLEMPLQYQNFRD